ncbi:PilN domain-containing protein [Pseudomonas stutzeri]|nr:PilN domain-containing protein [Stutzerimonas stutzeri]
MRPLDLDFRRPPVGPAGWGLLAGGALLLVLALLVERQLAAAGAAARADLAASERRLPGLVGLSPTPAEARAQQAALAEMQRLSAQLDLPWERLFVALEALVDADVALLGLTPDARQQQLRISAEARHLPAMLAFHRRLEDSAELRDVALVSHEILAEEPERPVRFNLTATWRVHDERR